LGRKNGQKVEFVRNLKFYRVKYICIMNKLWMYVF